MCFSRINWCTVTHYLIKHHYKRMYCALLNSIKVKFELYRNKYKY